MSFEPMGGFPPIIIGESKIEEKTLEARGFPSTNIVSIGDILEKKKKGETFLAFGTEEEKGMMLTRMLEHTPYEYSDMEDTDNTKKKKETKKEKNKKKNKK